MIVRSNRVVLPDGERRATIVIDRGIIVSIDRDDGGPSKLGPYMQRRVGAELAPPPERLDFANLVISPGIVDTHVHVNEPGRTDWEGFETATRAAAAGGVTALVDMPLNCVPATTDVAALEAKRISARGQCGVDVAFWGGVVPGNVADLDPLLDAGVRGFKCFLVPSGVDEFQSVGEGELREAMPILARRGAPLLVHAEDPRFVSGRTVANDDAAIAEYRAYEATRPPEAEVEAIRMMVRLSGEFGVQVHIVHVASADAVAEIARAKADGVAITAETCPHYLTFAAEEIPDGATQFKCAPPIRGARHRAALWRGLRDGALDLVATDHSPAPPSLKCPGDFGRAWGGIASLELTLAAVWTAGRDAALTPLDLARWMSDAPARLAGFDGRKGRIAVGHDADLMIWDPDAEMTVDPMRLQQRHKLTPYAGRGLRGVVRTTIVRGERVWADGAPVARGHGQLR